AGDPAGDVRRGGPGAGVRHVAEGQGRGGRPPPPGRVAARIGCPPPFPAPPVSGPPVSGPRDLGRLLLLGRQQTSKIAGARGAARTRRPGPGTKQSEQGISRRPTEILETCAPYAGHSFPRSQPPAPLRAPPTPPTSETRQPSRR